MVWFPRAIERAEPGMRSILLVSDVEMGEPGPEDDFPHDAFLADLMAAYTRPPYDGIPVDLVLNGDIFDFLKLPSNAGADDPVYPRHIDAQLALHKLEVVLAAHPAFLEGVRAFGLHDSGTKAVHMTVGNHDFELLFPEVQARLQAALADLPSVELGVMSTRIGPVHIEHGQQFDTMFRIDPDAPFGVWRDRKILHLPWGSSAIIGAVLPLKRYFYHHDRLRPKSVLFERAPHVQKILMNAFSRYWLRDFLFETLRDWSDPTLHLSWEMVREVLWRYSTSDTEVVWSEGSTHRFLEDAADIEAVCLGHTHTPSWTMLGSRYLVHTGCLRDEFHVSRGSDAIVPIPKSYGEVVLQDGHVKDIRLFHVQGPERPEALQPQGDLFEITPQIAALLGRAS